MIFNIGRLFKRAQADKGIWVGIDPLIFVLRNHPRRKDVYYDTIKHINRGVFGWRQFKDATSHGVITWHRSNMAPVVWAHVSMPDDNTIVVDDYSIKGSTREEMEEAGKELVSKLSSHNIRLAGDWLPDGKTSPPQAHRNFLQDLHLVRR
jgi:hypothetical protein